MMTTYDLSDVKPCPPAKGLQKVIEKYTKLVMKKLYGEDVLVFFLPDEHWPYAALYSDKLGAPNLWKLLKSG